MACVSQACDVRPDAAAPRTVLLLGVPSPSTTVVGAATAAETTAGGEGVMNSMPLLPAAGRHGHRECAVMLMPRYEQRRGWGAAAMRSSATERGL